MGNGHDDDGSGESDSEFNGSNEDLIYIIEYDSNMASTDSEELQWILASKFSNIATPIWCETYNVLHPTLMRNLVDWIFLSHQLCRGMRPITDASTGFEKVSVVNKCVELVFTNTDDTDKIFGVLSRNDVIKRLNDHKVHTTCTDMNVLLTNTKFNIPE